MHPAPPPSLYLLLHTTFPQAWAGGQRLPGRAEGQLDLQIDGGKSLPPYNILECLSLRHRRVNTKCDCSATDVDRSSGLVLHLIPDTTEQNRTEPHSTLRRMERTTVSRNEGAGPDRF